MRLVFNKPPKTKPVFMSEYGKIIKESKGEVSTKKIRFPKELGEAHPFDSKITQGLYKTFGMITGIVDKYVDFIVGPGFFVKSKNERAKKILEDFMKDNNFNTLLRAWIKEALIKPHGCLELGGEDINGKIEGMKVLDGGTIYVNRDDKGTIKNYKQFRDDVNEFNQQRDKVINFKPFQMARIMVDNVGDDPYGLGIVYPSSRAINSLICLQDNLEVLMKRKANAPIVANIGSPDNEPVEDDIKAVGESFEWLTNKHEWAFSYLVDFKVLDFGKFGEKFQFPLEHQMDMIMFGTQVPEVLMGKSVNLAVAPVQMDAFERRAKSIQEEVEKVIENDIFRRVLLSNKIQEQDVEFEWGQPSQEETNKRIAQITQLLGVMSLTPELRFQLEVELATLLKLTPENIVPPEVEREEEETQEAQPKVPGQNRPSGQSFPNVRPAEEWFGHSSTCCAHVKESLEEFDVKPLKEWLDFDYMQYLAFILQAIEQDKYEFLIAKNAAEVKLGKFTTTQISKLKGVLKEGFKEGKTLQEIAEGIKSKVKPKDLKNKDGKLIIGAESRNIAIARTETTRLASIGSEKNYQEHGIDEYSWVASYGQRTCPTCEGLNGQVFPIGKGPKPPAHGYCRCTIVPVVEK